MNENEFLKALVKTWEIHDEEILSETKNKIVCAFNKYSSQHFLYLRFAIIKHLETMDVEHRLAYIESKKVAYDSLTDTAPIAYIISLLSTGYLGSFLALDNVDSLSKVVAIVVFLTLFVIHVFMLTSRKRKFMKRLLDSIDIYSV